LKPITAEQIDAILPYLLVFESADFSPGKVSKTPPNVMPWLEHSSEVTAFIQTLYDTDWMADFDWGPWQGSARKYFDDPKKIERAKVGTIQKLLITHVREDRFCEGHLAEMIECGHIVALLRRLKVIREKMGSGGHSAEN
jgi:hypothetical protein